MVELTFRQALEYQLKNFTSSLLSFLSAISVDRALYHYLSKRQDKKPYTYIIASLILVTLAIGILSLLSWLDLDDPINQSKQSIYEEERAKIKELFRMHPFHQFAQNNKH